MKNPLVDPGTFMYHPPLGFPGFRAIFPLRNLVDTGLSQTEKSSYFAIIELKLGSRFRKELDFVQGFPLFQWFLLLSRMLMSDQR